MLCVQMMNLTHDWLRSFLPHVLTKIDRVSFGLLTPADLKRALEVRVDSSSETQLGVHDGVNVEYPRASSYFRLDSSEVIFQLAA